SKSGDGSQEGNPSTSSGGLHSFRFLRGRSTSVSAGNALDQEVSPTANANPYFAHQGQPAIRHYNESSRPPTPSSGEPQNPNLLALPTTDAGPVANDRTSQAGKDE